MKGPEKLLLIWEADLRIICHSHNAAAVIASRRNFQLVIPTIILSALVGTAIFSTLGTSRGKYFQIIAGLLSMLVSAYRSFDRLQSLDNL